MSFRLLGVYFEITVPFCLVLAFTLLVDRTGLMTYMLLAVGLHEGGHLLAMARFAALPKAVCLKAGRVSMEKSGRLLGARQEMAIAAAGPLVNLACAGLGRFLYSCTGWYGAAVFCAVHTLFAAYNLLPVLGLDGGTLCLLACTLRMGEERAWRCMRLASWALVVCILAAGAFLILRGFANPTLLLVGVYLAAMQALKGGKDIL